jgi:hypothetical protein
MRVRRVRGLQGWSPEPQSREKGKRDLTTGHAVTSEFEFGSKLFAAILYCAAEVAVMLNRAEVEGEWRYSLAGNDALFPRYVASFTHKAKLDE